MGLREGVGWGGERTFYEVAGDGEAGGDDALDVGDVHGDYPELFDEGWCECDVEVGEVDDGMSKGN